MSCLTCTSSGKRSTGYESGQQTLPVKNKHVHQRYLEGRPEYDLAVLVLDGRINFKKDVIAACLPEKSFAESVLMSGEYSTVITGWKETPQAASFAGPLMFNQLAYDSLSQCLERHPDLMTNKMGCTTPRANADCGMNSGSPLLTLYRDVFFLTGVVSQPTGADCTDGFIFQKVSRYLGWLHQYMGSR